MVQRTSACHGNRRLGAVKLGRMASLLDPGRLAECARPGVGRCPIRVANPSSDVDRTAPGKQRFHLGSGGHFAASTVATKAWQEASGEIGDGCGLNKAKAYPVPVFLSISNEHIEQ